jgi:hypothetical protein
MADLILPDPRMEMPELFEPGRKPVWPVVIDWRHPLAKGLESFYLCDSEGIMRDVTGRHAVTFSPAPDLASTADGQCLAFDSGSSQYGSAGANCFSGATEKMTLSVRCSTVYSGVNKVAFGLGSFQSSIFRGAYISVAFQKYRYVVDYGPNGAQVTPATNLTIAELGQARELTGVSRSDTDHELFMLGDSIATSTQNVGSSFPGDVDSLSMGASLVGSPAVGTSFFSGNIYHAAYWRGRALTKSEVKLFSANPYQFLKPAGGAW